MSSKDEAKEAVRQVKKTNTTAGIIAALLFFGVCLGFWIYTTNFRWLSSSIAILCFLSVAGNLFDWPPSPKQGAWARSIFCIATLVIGVLLFLAFPDASFFPSLLIILSIFFFEVFSKGLPAVINCAIGLLLLSGGISLWSLIPQFRWLAGATAVFGYLAVFGTLVKWPLSPKLNVWIRWVFCIGTLIIWIQLLRSFPGLPQLPLILIILSRLFLWSIIKRFRNLVFLFGFIDLTLSIFGWENLPTYKPLWLVLTLFATCEFAPLAPSLFNIQTTKTAITGFIEYSVGVFLFAVNPNLLVLQIVLCFVGVVLMVISGLVALGWWEDFLKNSSLKPWILVVLLVIGIGPSIGMPLFFALRVMVWQYATTLLLALGLIVLGAIGGFVIVFQTFIALRSELRAIRS